MYIVKLNKNLPWGSLVLSSFDVINGDRFLGAVTKQHVRYL